MNEEYLKGYFNSYVKPKKSDAVYEDWVAKISTNEEYKRGMFNTYVKPQKADAIYEDWNTKIFGTTQPTVEQKKMSLLLRKLKQYRPFKIRNLSQQDRVLLQLQQMKWTLIVASAALLAILLIKL